jgi:MFS family permease
VISPIVGTALVARNNFAAIFYAVGGIGVFAFVLTLLLPAPKEEAVTNPLKDDDDGHFSIGAMLDVIKQPQLWPWYTVIVVNMFFVGILFGFLPVRVALLNYDPTTRGIILSAAALSYLLVQPIAGMLADRVSPIRTVQVGLIASGVGIVLVPFVSDLPLLLVTIFAGLGIGTVWTNSDAVMSSLAKQGRLGSTMGIAGSFKEFGDMLGPLIIGIISQLFGLTVGFVACGLLGIASVFLILGKERAVANS